MDFKKFVLDSAKNINNVYKTASETGKALADKKLQDENAILRDRINRANKKLEETLMKSDLAELCMGLQQASNILEEQ